MTTDTSSSELQSEPAVSSVTNGDQIALATSRAINLEDGHAFEMPARLFEQLPFAIYICDQDGFLLRYNRRAAELWGCAPKIGDRNERFCGSYRMFRPNGTSMPHDECPMADVLRTGISVRQGEVHIERPDGSRGVALVDIEAIKDNLGNIIGAVNCFQDVTDRKQAEERERLLARELDHRAKNLLALVQAAVQLTQANTVKDFRAAIEGRLHALAHAHSLLAQSRWFGADLRTLVTEELVPFRVGKIPRAEISGPTIILEPKSAQSIAIILHELTTNAVKHGSLSASAGRLRVEWSCGEADLVLRWFESDGPLVEAPSREGMGTRLIGPMVQNELGGKYRFEWKSCGFACEISIPIERVVADRQ